MCPLCHYNLKENGGGALKVIDLPALICEALGAKYENRVTCAAAGKTCAAGVAAEGGNV